MIYIKKNSPPKKFVEFVQKNKHAHFDDMPSDIKQIVRDSLLKGQGYLCAYCMSKININDKKIEQKKIEEKIKIEHYVPRNNKNELDYKNLLAVCSGNSFGNEEKHQHCDTKKGNKTLKIDPQRQYNISQISYKPDGTIYSKNKEFDDDLNKVLNLNDDEGCLKQRRKEALDTLKSEIHKIYKDKTATLNFLKKTLNFYTSLNEKGELQPYCGILIEYLENKINNWHK